MTPEQEQKCIGRLRQGDTEAFEPLLLANQKTVYNLCLRMLQNAQDAEDMTQECFLKAYRSIGSFRGESKFSVWLLRIASNLCLDRLRQRKRRPADSLTVENEEGESEELELTDERFSPEKLLEQKLTREAVRRGLDALPEAYREVLLLRELQGLSYEEIGTVTGLEAGTVKSRIFRARKRLCAFLLEDGNLPDFVTSQGRGGGERP